MANSRASKDVVYGRVGKPKYASSKTNDYYKSVDLKQGMDNIKKLFNDLRTGKQKFRPFSTKGIV